MTTTPRLELQHITKVYPAVVANDDISLTVQAGEIHAVLGENGAGKSTLMKLIYGITKADHGSFYWNGQPVQIDNPAQARELGIGMVFQHFSLFETLTVAENIALAIPGRFELGHLSDRISTVSRHYGLPLDPGRYVHSLSVGERQRVEIVRCLLQSPSLLIMDEPTSVLTPQAIQTLFATLRQLAAEGCSILYISHKLNEIRDLCHRATVLRSGRVTGTVDPRQRSAAELAQLMIGRELPVYNRSATSALTTERLVLDRLTLSADEPFGVTLRDVSLAVCGGEIVGIAGISGNGQRELLAVLSGERCLEDPEALRLDTRPVATLPPAARRELGLGFIPEERIGRGAVGEMNLTENTLLTAHRQQLLRAGFIRIAKAKAFARRIVQNFNVVCNSLQAPADSLSGGNLQKFIVGREILQQPGVIIAAQPTWGVDVGAAALIRQALIDLSQQGIAVLVISEDLDELFEICDRIAVLSAGRLSTAKPCQETDQEKIGLQMGGGEYGV